MTDLLRLISKTADGLFAVDADYRIILWNRAAEEALGFTSKEMLGKLCCEVLPWTVPSGNSLCFKGCPVMTLAKQGQLIRNFDVHAKTKSGHKVRLNVSILLVPGPRRNQPVIVHFFRALSSLGNRNSLAEQVAAAVLETLKKEGRISRAGQAGPKTNASSLTRRETEILQLMARCISTKEIADRLCISYTTVRTHIQHILKKLHAHSKLEAVAMAFQQNLL